MANLSLRLRYCLTYGHEKTDISERDLRRDFLEVEIPAEQAAIVLVDVWDRHYLKSHLERGEQITHERIVPTLEACRAAGVTVVHAPAPQAARKYEEWLRYAGDEELFGVQHEAPSWPPPDFRSRSGEYACLARKQGSEAVKKMIQAQQQDRRIIPAAEPKPGDFVVANGRQLHRLCRHRRLLHLFYAGFATNMCVVARDYGIRAMAALGYNCMLLRDCTSGIETAETLDTMMLTEATFWQVELLHGFTLTSDELIEACRQATAGDT